MYSLVVAEIACGNVRDRIKTLDYLPLLPTSKAASDLEVLDLIEARRISGLVIGGIDAHLLASALLGDYVLWTLDKNLQSAALAAKVKLYTASSIKPS